MHDYNVIFNSEEDYNSFINSLEGYNFYKCGFDSPSMYPAVLEYSCESCPDSRDKIYKGEYSYPEDQIKKEAERITNFIKFLEDRFDYRLHEETTKFHSEYTTYSIVDCNKVLELAKEWLRKNRS